MRQCNAALARQRCQAARRTADRARSRLLAEFADHRDGSHSFAPGPHTQRFIRQALAKLRPNKLGHLDTSYFPVEVIENAERITLAVIGTRWRVRLTYNHPCIW